MIQVKSLHKVFRLYKKPADRLKEILLRRTFHTEHHALSDISFEVADGETLGIIGQNGAGKSTLLKILTGILIPDAGSIHVDGKITGLLELGTGFNSELTGIQNMYANGLLLGMSKEELDSKRDAIVAFSELGEFILEPVKTYSSGMAMRLGFAIAIHAEPKCFVVDEALSVGDAHFQQKCMNRIKEFRRQGGSIIFVSHDLNAVKMLCDRALLIDHGRIVEEGIPDNVVNAYNFLIAKLNDHNNRLVLENRQQHAYGTLEAEILDVTVIGEGSGSATLSAGEHAVVQITIRAYSDIDDVTAGILIRDKYGQDIFGTNSHLLRQRIHLGAGCEYDISFRMAMNIGPGKYTVTAALHTEDTHMGRCYHWCDSMANFAITGIHGERFVGICKLTPSISYTRRNSNAKH